MSDSTQALVEQGLSFTLRSIRLDGGFSDRPSESFAPVIQPGTALAADDSGGLIPSDNATRTVGVRIPSSAADELRVTDAKSGIDLGVRMVGAGASNASVANGVTVYPDALGSGSHLYRTVAADGVEDFAIIPDGGRSSVSYQVSTAHVAGLRLVSNTLEFLDENGDPRLRLAQPWVVDSRGENRMASVAVTGCKYDTSAAPPWGRPVVSPGSATCQVRVTWSDADLTYPLLLDPSWSGTLGMSNARYGHAMSAPKIGSNYLAMACGGIYGTTFLKSCEYYNSSSGTWSGGTDMNTARAYFVMADASDTCTVGYGGCPGLTFVAGGWAGTSPCLYTSTAAWETLDWNSPSQWNGYYYGPRVIAAAAASDDTGKLLVTGGFEGQMISGTCYPVYDTGTYKEYDFINGGFSNRAELPSGHYRAYHTATTLSTGHSVFVVGGHDATTTRTDAYTYNRSLDSWTAVSAANLGVYCHTATLLTYGSYSGQVLVMGGFDPYGTPRNTIQKYDPAGGGTWNTSFGTTPQTRAWHAAVRYGSGDQVLWIGGRASTGTTQKSAYLWPSGTQTNMALEREQFTAGYAWSRLLVAGGYRTQSGNAMNNAEYYVP